MGTFLQGGMPSKRESSARADYVPAQGTHRPSLPPIECSGALFGLAQCSALRNRASQSLGLPETIIFT